MKKAGWIFLLITLVSIAARPVETRVITGTVTEVDGGQPMPGVNIMLKGKPSGVVSDTAGHYQITVPQTGGTLVFSFIDYVTREIKIGSQSKIDVTLAPDKQALEEVVVIGYGQSRPRKEKILTRSSISSQVIPGTAPGFSYSRTTLDYSETTPEPNTEAYNAINENIFHSPLKNALSTFSIDVDAASYSNVRRFINNGQRPPKDAVRIEEMVNYFHYDYEAPDGKAPFNVITEVSAAPWNAQHQLVHIGLQGKKIPTEELPPSNLVFLIDVSGSMNASNKLPLLKSSFKMLVESLRAQDHVAIVVYAGAAGLVLKPTAGDQKHTIFEAIDRLQAGGSTAGGEGIELAYAVAKEHFKKDGNNRVILATDGDFNVGDSSDTAMQRLIESKRRDGIFLTALGFGMGNYKDSKMETLADKGNGNYAYIDNITEARKVLVHEFGGTLFTIAKDVKIQIEFNPTHVKAYRLIGYENRLLNDEDFNNDKKDAGELGSGHTVTALYEIIPTGVDSKFFSVDDLKYQQKEFTPTANASNELMTVKLRYKKPDEDVSKLIVHTLKNSSAPLTKTSNNFRWSASVAAFGMLLRESEYANDFSYEQVVALAEKAKGEDSEGYRSEFISMVKSFGLVARH